MPLSEHEQQLLQQMEQALYAEDPKFASQMQGAGARAAARRRWIIGGVGALVGLGVVLLGVSTQRLWVGAVGFAVMVAATVFALTPARRARGLGAVQADGTVGPRSAPRKAGRARRATLMHRLEERWDRRRHN